MLAFTEESRITLRKREEGRRVRVSRRRRWRLEANGRDED